jgi:hypothetical protein
VVATCFVRLWSGGAGSPIRRTATGGWARFRRTGARPHPVAARCRGRRLGVRAAHPLGRRSCVVVDVASCALVGAMPRRCCRWPQMLGHRPSARVVRGQALAGRLHRSLLVTGRAPPEGGDRCPAPSGCVEYVAWQATFSTHPPRGGRPLAPRGGAGFAFPRCPRRVVPPTPAAGRRDRGSPRWWSALVVGGRQGTEGKRSWGRLVANRGSAGAAAVRAWGVGRLIPVCGGFLSPPPPPGRTCAGPRAVRHASAPALRSSTRAALRARVMVHLAETQLRRSAPAPRRERHLPRRTPRTSRNRAGSLPSVPWPRSAGRATRRLRLCGSQRGGSRRRSRRAARSASARPAAVR